MKSLQKETHSISRSYCKVGKITASRPHENDKKTSQIDFNNVDFEFLNENTEAENL